MAQNDIISLATGLTDSLNKYLGLGVQNQLQQRLEQRQLQNQMQVKQYETNLDLAKLKAHDAYKLTLEGKVDPDAAAAAHPKAAYLVKKFAKTNERMPTVAEFNTLVKTMPDDNKPGKLTGAQGVVDREFAKEYTKYVASGGYADTINQIQSLEGVLEDLRSGKDNITGPLVGTGQGPLTGLPRKLFASKSVEAQQTVEQSVQRTLKATLGGQFTEREGLLFMQRGYDPQLSEAANAKKLESMISRLKSMALSKQKAVDYYEEHGTLNGFKGEFYTLKNGEVVKASKDDFYSMIGEKPQDTKGKDPLGLGI